MKRRVADHGADRQGFAIARLPGQFRDLVDIDEMSGARQPERHDGNETLSARQDASVFGAELGEHADGLVDRFRNVTNERRGLHEWQFLRKWQGDTDKLTMPLSSSRQRSASIAALEPETSLTDRSRDRQ